MKLTSLLQRDKLQQAGNITAICIQAQTANVLTRCLRFRTWRLPFETEAIQMRKYAN